MIRPYRPSDAPAVAAIYAPFGADTTISFELEAPDTQEMARRLESIPAFVAEIESEVVGFAYAGPFRPRPAYRFTVENSVYVRTPGRGIGRRLMEALIEECARRGFRRMIAVIADGGTSVPFHRALGFEVAGRLEGVGTKFGREVGITLMQRALP